MKNRNILAIAGIIWIFTLAGCGTASTNPAEIAPNTGMGNMSNMVMTNTAQLSGVKQAFLDELNGFTTIEKDVQKGNYTDATTLANNLHDEFHVAILPPLKAKKGSAYAENIHSKYDELQDAIKGKNQSQIRTLIQVNRGNLYTVANMLNVELPK